MRGFIFSGIHPSLLTVIFVLYFFDCAMLGLNKNLSEQIAKRREERVREPPIVRTVEETAGEVLGENGEQPLVNRQPETAAGEGEEDDNSGEKRKDEDEEEEEKEEEEEEGNSGSDSSNSSGSSGQSNQSPAQPPTPPASPVRQAAQNVGSAVKAGDSTAFYNLLSEDIREAFGPSAVKQALASSSLQVSKASVLFEPEVLEGGDWATTTVRFTFSDGSFKDYLTVLKKETGGWKLFGTQEK